MTKIAACTTFPKEQFEICAAEMIASFHAHWPEDIKMYVQLDPDTDENSKALWNACIDAASEERLFISNAFDQPQLEFIERWKDHKPQSYMDDVVRFSHKIFTVEKCADALKDEYDYLIWLDADVITKSQITHEWLQEVLPQGDQLISYLDRPGLYPECGWVAYNLKAGAYDLIKDMFDIYVLDRFDKISAGWTDCHVLQECLQAYDESKLLNLSTHYEHGTTAIEVWPKTKLAEKMVHRKGNRKYAAAQNREQKIENGGKEPLQVVDVNNMGIKTKNCLDHEKICGNVRENLSQIRHWITLCQPTEQDIVICSAGPSLINHIDEIKAHQAEGDIIVAVKHALDLLERHDITPDYCVLLDPRGHVEGFISSPDPEVVYLVASMCDPSVVKTLNKNKCSVIGYHALVNAGELNELIPGDLPVSGGSATSTRSIGVFADIFGYKNFHLYGYDLCHHQKPDLNEALEDGNPKYLEVNLGTETWGHKYETRTFWTEGQFLAQSQELVKLYKERKDIKMNVYGDGIAGWMYKHYTLHQKFIEEYNAELERKREGTPTMKEYIDACSRGSQLSRGN